MHSNQSTRLIVALFTAFSAFILVACNQTSTGGNSTASADSGKIPITTKSEEARNDFLQGRDLSDKLQTHDSLQYFDKAIALDPDFASAELERANNSPTTAEFFDHQKKAVALAERASEGEKLLILANEAGSNGDVADQKEYLTKLVSAFPNDERAQFALANFYSGQQEQGPAIEHFKKATEIAPNLATAYNSLGYAYKLQGDYGDAEQAFKKYIELIPNDPNPYDSYAELLLKMGRFEDSIAQYNKALSIDSNFNSSHFGIAADLLYMGKAKDAAAELQKMASAARNDRELRTALFGMSVVDSDSGNFAKALQEIDKEYAVAEKKNDVSSMAADLQAKGNILSEMSRYDEAKAQFDRSLQLIESSSLSQDIKDNATLLHHYNMSAVAIGKKDYAAASAHLEEFRQAAEASKNPAQIKLAHELAGRIALAQKDYDNAIAELQQANQQNPRNLYRLGQAYEGKHDAKAHEFYAQAAEFYPLPQLPYAFIRAKAQKMSGSTKAG